jgi:hypothetical protein
MPHLQRGGRCEGLQQEALLAVETHARALARRAMQAHIRHALEPELALVIEIRIMQEDATVDEIAAHIADGALDLPFGRSRALHRSRVMRISHKFSRSRIRSIRSTGRHSSC